MHSANRLRPFALEKRDAEVPDAAGVTWPAPGPGHEFVYHLQPVRAPGRIGVGETVFELSQDLTADEVGLALLVLCGGIPGFDEIPAQYGGYDVALSALKPHQLVFRPSSAVKAGKGSLPPLVYSVYGVA